MSIQRAKIGAVMGSGMGSALGADMGGSSSLDPILSMSPHSRWRADTNITFGTGTNVASWADMVSGRVLAASSQPVWSANDANFLSQSTLTFNGTNNQIQYTGPAGDYAYLHGAASSALVVWRGPSVNTSVNVLLSTKSDGLATNAGFRLHNASLVIANGASFNANSFGVIGATANQTSWISYRYTGTPGASQIALNASGVAQVNPTFGSTNGATAPAAALSVGYSTTEGRAFNGQIAEIVLFDRRLSDVELASCQSYFVSRYGAVA